MSLKRIVALITVYVITCAAWMILAGVTASRTQDQSHRLRGEVSSLWGQSHTQSAPTLSFRAVVPSRANISESVPISDEELALLELVFPPPPAQTLTEKIAADEARKEMTAAELEAERQRWVLRTEGKPKALNASHLKATLHSDPRRRGLVWFALYDVSFHGEYLYEHQSDEAGYVDLKFTLPVDSAIYDQLIFRVNERELLGSLDPDSGTFNVSVPVKPGSKVSLVVGYKSRGSKDWKYSPGGKVQRLSQFQLEISTDFSEIDFPDHTVSPTKKVAHKDGWALMWDFKSTITGKGMGVILPQRLQPGELSTAMIFSAPVSLLFFFVVLIVVALLQNLDIHPVNYLFIGAAFFAFHLLFSYSADYLSVRWAFGISSVVSLFLVTSYLRLVVSPRFALREAALGQLIYLIGFSMAHFWEGFTGLTITVLAIITLFFLMQATGRMRWTDVFAAKKMGTSENESSAAPLTNKEPAQTGAS